jgi:chlorophyll synthase
MSISTAPTDRAPLPPLRAPAPRAVLELMKPITWFAPMWAYGCGLVSSGQPFSAHALTVGIGILLCGPLVCGTSQAINDWFDRHVDAINEPNRPIPSGRIPGRWGLGLAIALTAISAAVATLLGAWGFYAALAGLALAWAYSAPPLRLKRNGWWGNSAVAACYEGLPWFTGAAVMAGALPDAKIIALAALYSFGAHGIMTLNDFKSVEGDRQLGVGSLPVRLGVRAAGIVACLMMAAPQVVVVALLFAWQRPWFALAVLGLLIAQGLLMARLLKDPKGRAPWYNATGTTLYVAGMLVSAFALAQLVGAA